MREAVSLWVDLVWGMLRFRWVHSSRPTSLSKLMVTVMEGGPLAPAWNKVPWLPKRYPQGVEAREGKPGQGEGSSPGKVLQKQNPFVVASCLPSGLGAPGSGML